MPKIKDIMTTDMVTVTMQDNVYEIAVKMKEHDIGIIPVVDGKKLIGVVTDRDLVIRGYAERRSGSAAVEQVISEKVITVSPGMDVKDAAQMMAREQVRRLPVVENGELKGIVAIGDLAVRQESDQKAGEALSEISESEAVHNK